jgi:hypothetical protein
MAGEPGEVARNLFDRFEVDPNDFCTVMGVSELQRLFLLFLDPYAQILWDGAEQSDPRYSNQRLNGWQLAPSLSAANTRGEVLSVEKWSENHAVRIQFRRFEEDARSIWEVIKTGLVFQELAGGVLDLRSAAGLDLTLADQLLASIRESVNSGGKWLVLVDRYTRGVAELVAYRLKSEISVLVVGEKTQGAVRAPQDVNFTLPGSLVPTTVRLSALPLGEDALEIERTEGILPEAWVYFSGNDLVLSRQSSLGAWGVSRRGGLTLPRTHPLDRRTLEPIQSEEEGNPPPAFLQQIQNGFYREALTRGWWTFQ